MNENSGNTPYVQQRKILNLPQPQISEAELEDIAKLSKSGSDGISGFGMSGNYGMNAEHNHNQTPLLRPHSHNMSEIRTPSTQKDRIKEQATNALRMQNTQTPLLGGDNVHLYQLKNDWSGVTPKHQNIATPNINTPGIGGGGRSMEVDTGLQSVASVMSSASSASTATMSDRKRRKREKKKRKRLREEFENLPEALYDYEVALPAIPDQPYKSDGLWIEDKADRDQRRLVEEEMEYEMMKKKQSLVIQKELPRPKQMNSGMKLDFDSLALWGDKTARLIQAEEMLRKEMMDLIYFDEKNAGNVSYGSEPKRKKRKLVIRKEEFSDEQLLNAKKLLEKEIKHQCEVHEKEEKSDEEMSDGDECVYIPRLKSYRYIGWRQFNDKLEAKKQEFAILNQQIMNQRNKIKTMEQKLNIKMGGYNRVGLELLNKNINLRNKLIEMEQNLLIYEELQDKETRIIPQRIKKWNELIKKEKERQYKLQNQYEKLRNQHDELLQGKL